jgi:hypothetical protein
MTRGDEGPSAGLTPPRRSRPTRHEMLAQHIARVAGQAAFLAQQNQGRGGTARSTKVPVESRDDLEDKTTVSAALVKVDAGTYRVQQGGQCQSSVLSAIPSCHHLTT